MERAIHNFSTSLEEYVKTGNYDHASKLISNINTQLIDNIGMNTLNYMVSNIFDESYNLLRFLKSVADRKEWKTALSHGLILLDNFLNNFLSTLKPYILEISKTCCNIVLSRASVYEKAKALQILCLILDNDSDIALDEVKDIYNKFYNFVRAKNTTSTVQKNVFILLGIILKKYPFLINNQEALIEIILRHLRSQSEMPENKTDKYIVSGCIDGLSHILDTFPVDGDEIRNRIYSSVKKLLNTNTQSYELRDVLKFLTKHCSLLAEQMYNDSPEWWNDKLNEWTIKSGDNCKAGYVALNAFYAELASVLQKRTEEKDTRIFKYFYNYFLRTMKNNDAQILQVRLAICGFGKFAGPCKVHMSKQELSQMFIIIINRMEQDYFVKEEPSMEQLEYLPDYIQCFSTILHYIGEYTFDQIDALQQISVLMVKSFPRLSPIYYISVYDSMILSMCYLYQFNPTSLKSYLERVVYQSVLWTCSHRTTFDVDLDDEQGDFKKAFTYRNYLPLWKSLLSFSTNDSNKNYSKISRDVQESVSRHLYNELIKTLLILINKLNLTTKSKYSDDEPVVDPQTAYQAEKIDDFVIFINVVDFYSHILPVTECKFFKRRIEMYNNQIMTKSVKYPLVSGFYKLLRISLELSEKLKYFDEAQLEKEDRRESFTILCSFLENVLLKVQEFKDDLQVSCLQLLLAIPVSFVERLLPAMGPAFHMVFTIGRGYLKLAETAVDTLEKWYRFVPTEKLKPLFKEILPYLDPFLRSKGYTGDPDIKISLLHSRKTKQSKSKHRVYIESDGELSSLQQKILMFVGQLNSEICMYLVDTDVQIESVTWKKEPQLKFTVPYDSVKPNIYLDKIVPRIVELALSSGDQKTRITACELLHATVIYMLGTSRTMAPEQSKMLSRLFEKLILPLIQLGCDSHEVIRQLFNPLIFQLVHWYSSPMQLMSSESVILVNTLMEGISHPTDTAVRDLSGKCIREFVIWSIKQNQQSNFEKYSINIKTILNKLCQYCSHPNAFKRLGAALAFNNLYTHLREERSLVDMYWIELLYWLLINMSLLDVSKRSKIQKNTQIEQSLNHIERVLRENSFVFKEDSKKRRVPAAFKGCLLEDAVLWILEQSGSLNITYRRKCIKLFTSLAPYCNGSGTTNDFIRKYVEKSEHVWFLKLYENDGIQKMATLNDYEQCASVDVLVKWLNYFLRCLDAYKFLLDYNIIDNKKLITDSKIYISLKDFIDYVSKRNLVECMELFQNWDQNEVYMPEDIEDFYQMKRLTLFGVLDFLLSVIEKDTTCSEEFQTESYMKFLCNCVFEPNVLGFETTAKENTEKLSVKVIEVLNKFYKKMPASLIDDLCTYFFKYFFTKYDENVQINAVNVPVLQRQLLKGFILLLKSDLKEKMPKPVQYFNNTVKNISDNLVKESGNKKIGIVLQNTVQEYTELKLTLAFQITDQIATLCDCLAKKEIIQIPETSSTVPVGEFFLNSFKDIIMNYVAEHANDVVKNLCMRWQTFSDNSSLKIVMIILKYLSEDKQMRKKTYNCDLTDSIMSQCENIFKSSLDVTLYDRNFQIEFMTRVASIEDNRTCLIADRYPFFKTWFIRQLRYDPFDIAPRNMLHFKTNVLSFLPCVTGPDEDSNDALQSALSSFQSKLTSQPTDQIDNADRIVLFKRLLDYLIMSRSRIVLKSVADILTGIKYDDKDINIDRALESYMETITAEQQYKSICVVYLLCRNDNYSAECKYKIGKNILMILLRVCKYEAFERFYIERIKDILANLRLTFEVDCDANMLVNKSMNFMLIEALFSRINDPEFTDKSCRITKAAYDGVVSTGKELLFECTNIAKLVRKEKLEFTDANLKEFYRMYHCNAFNAIVSIFSNSRKTPDYINLYSIVFRENQEDFIWKKMIDCTSVISVPQDFDMLPIRKKVFINIRNENVTKSSRRIRYIESQNLFNSTLSEDICKFDFTNTLIRKVEVFDSNKPASESLGNITIECVDMNNHECMATVCGLIRHLIDSGISPLPKDEEDLGIPKWMKMIQKLMLDTSTLVNVKMFFARVIHNMKHIFKHYARYFFEPVSKFIVDKCAGNNINYLVADLVEMLVTWSQNITLDDIKNPASQLVQFLMENAHNDRHDMLKYNMEIIKTVVEAWKTFIVVPHDVLRAKISKGSNQQLAGINLISIMLANNLVPWTNENLNSLMTDLVDIVQKKTEKVFYRPAAEVLGMCLQKLSSNANYSKEFKELSESIETVLNSCTTDKLFHVMEQIQIHYPSIIDKHIQTIYFKMCTEKNLALKCICLRNILRRFEYIEFSLLTTKDYISFLRTDDHNLRLLTLQIIHKTIPILSQPNTKLIVPAVCEHKLDSNGMIRCAVYDVLIAIYRKYIQETDNTESKELIETCKSVLIAGLVDSDLELQEKMQKFWCHDSLKLPQRFIKTLTDLYTPDTELFYMGCANFFLLEACKNTPEYDKLMFEHPLSDCKFDDIQMLINWRARYASMAPMFANTMDTQFGNEDHAFPEMIGVRASVSAKAFAPTASVLNVSSSLNPTSSLLFESTPIAGPSTVRNVENINVSHEEPLHKQHSRRFLRDLNKIGLSFAKYEVDKKKKKTELRKELVQRKDANVVMYRKYRTGELPDVQIPYSAILQPLQMLARRDGVLARQLYVMLFNGLLHEMSDITEFINKFNQGIISVFNQTNMYVPNVIGTFLDIALENNKTRGRPKIFIKPDLLSTVCRNSGLLPVGCLLLEDVISSSEVMPSSSKKGCANSDDTVNQWVKLADMYKELNEWDAVIGIFSSKHMECSETVLSAIHAEANGQWRDALKYYQQMLDTDTNFNRKDFYYDSIFKSYANLSEWESISSYGENFDEGTLWDGDWHQEKILPWYMTSQVCVALEGKNTATILDNLEKWMKSKDKSEYLKDKFSEELAMLALYKDDVNASRHYVQNSISKFLEDWSHLNPLFSKIRASRLLNFQKIIDLNKYVSRTDNNFGGLLDYWQENSDFSCPSVHISEIRTLYRQQILTSYEQKITQLHLDDVEEQKLLIKHLKLSNDINLISSSLERNNYFVARKYCKKYGSYIQSEDGSVEGLKLSIAVGKIGTVVAEMYSGSDKVSTLIKSWKSLDSIFKRCTYPDLRIESALQIFVITQSIFSVLKDNTALISEYQKDLVTLTGGDVTAAVDVQIYGTRKLGCTIEVENEVAQYSNNAKVTNNIIKAYLSLIVFAQNHENSNDYSADIAKYVLHGMKLGSQEARQLFPCLLQMPADEITDVFKSESSTVPTWMFVAWIPQILATLDTPTARMTADVVIRIATAYPQALVYAYRLSKEKYNLQDDSAFFKELINKLDELLHNELIDKFINELSCVCIPQLYFNYHVNKIIHYTNNYKSVKEKITNFINDFNGKMKSSKYFKTIQSSVQELGEILNKNSDWDEIKKCLNTLCNKVANEGTKINIKQYTKLNDCSSWLANYKASEQNLELEIPGQYTGDRKPLLKYHAKISSFQSEITCMPSLRKPMKIVIFGNDSREYPFLLKFGEDLRQDQRIQQLLSLANNILHCDLQCRQRNLAVERFEVTPLTTSLGLIKWVDGTTSLATLIYESADDPNKIVTIRAQYREWIERASKGACSQHVYFWNALSFYSQNETIKKFTSFVNEIPANVLSQAFWHISMDTESYTSLRHQFITSYASMCLVHWLFGIGDRNLGNCLILQNTGRAVGIDFGFTFGAGTQNLAIPELIPFRLTPHILHMMDPLRETGFIEHTMIHCLRALRKQKHIVASTMSVFINEPSVDWLEYARSQQNTDDGQSSGNWYPKRKVSLARRKLDGANPATITIEELKDGCVRDSKVLENYIKLVRGDDSNVRAQMAQEDLTEEEQVKCLLDQATDYNILGRMFHGLELWI